MSKYIVEHSLEQHTKSIADFLPEGKIFTSAYDVNSVLYKFLRGLSHTLHQVESVTAEYQDEFFPDTTSIYLNEWESALGIPDGCFSGDGTNQQRRDDIITKIQARGTQTLSDVQELATRLGFTITIRKDDIPVLPFDLSYNLHTDSGNRNTLFVTIDGGNGVPSLQFTLPASLGGSESVLKCLINKVVSAKVQIIYE